MSEFVKKFDIPNGNLVAAGAAGTIEVEIPIPVGASKFSLQIAPKDSGAAPDLSYALEYKVGSDFFPTNPVTSGALVKNQATPVTVTDAVTRVRLSVTNGASVIDGDVLIHLFMTRG